MNTVQAIGILLLGLGFGSLLTWIQQTHARMRFRNEIKSEIDDALSSPLRRQPASETQNISRLVNYDSGEPRKNIRAA